MEVEHNAVCAEATRAPTCGLMRGPMLCLRLRLLRQLRRVLLAARNTHRGIPFAYVARILLFKRGFLGIQRLHLTDGGPRARAGTRTNAQQTHLKASVAPKTTIKQKAQMTPSCDNPKL